MKRLGALAVMAVMASGCAAGSATHVGEHFSMSGTPEGIRSFSDALVGTMKTAKEGADAPSQYFVHRATYETNVTARGGGKGFIQKLLGGSEEGAK